MANKAIKGEGPFIGTRRYWGIWVSYKTPLACERNLWNVGRYLYDGLCTLRDRTAMHLFSPTFVRHPYWVNLIFAFILRLTLVRSHSPAGIRAGSYFYPHDVGEWNAIYVTIYVGVWSGFISVWHARAHKRQQGLTLLVWLSCVRTTQVNLVFF